MLSRISLAIAILVLTGTLVLNSPLMVMAEPTVQGNATLTFSGRCDVTGASPNFACSVDPTEGDLRLQQNAGDPTIVGILRFNVDQTWTIDKARLNLALAHAGACAPTPNIAVRIYATSNGDANPPQRGVLLATVDGGTTGVPFPGNHSTSPAYNAWTDSSNGTFAQAIQSQNAGDNVITLWVEQTVATGSVFFGGAAPTDLNTLCGSGAGGSLIGAPVLQLADVAGPLAVTLSTLTAASPVGTPWGRYALFAGVIGLAAAALVWIRRR